MSGKFVLDACAIIAFLNDEEGADKVEELLWQRERFSCTLFIHEINLLEIYYGVYRDESEELAGQTDESSRVDALVRSSKVTATSLIAYAEVFWFSVKWNFPV